MNDSVFMVTIIENGRENMPDFFHYFDSASEYLTACLERMVIDISKCKYEESTDIDGFDHYVWTDITKNGFVTVARIDEYALR